MNAPSPVIRKNSVCPHDCPSACSVEVEVLQGNRIGRVYGAPDQSYTAGVICAKVARYAERVHHPDRVLYPMMRTGPKGSGQFTRISWDEALDRVAEAFNTAERDFGAQSIWPYYYAGTMGLVMRDGINRLSHAKGYSRFYSTICINMAWPGFMAGTGKLAGPDPREMAESDCVVIWGTNAVATQVNVMTHAIRARKERGAKIVVVDIYDNATMKQADLALCLRPGTDGALACARDACPVPRGARGSRIPGKMDGRPARTRRAPQDPDPGMGIRHHRPARFRNRGFRPACRHDQADLLQARIRVFAPAQRFGQHACRVLHRQPSQGPGSTRAAALSIQ